MACEGVNRARRSIDMGYSDNRMLDFTAEGIEPLITPRTRVIVVVHYAGVACDMDAIMALAAPTSGPTV